MKELRLAIALAFCSLTILFGSFAYAQTDTASEASDPGSQAPGPGNNQIISKDAIGLRVVPNPEHYSPLQWYQYNIKVKGAPQSLVVDGYEAVRDGRTVYVNAAKLVRVNRCSDNPGIICQNDNQCGQGNPSETLLPNIFIKTALAAGTCVASSIPELYTNIYIISYNQDPEAATTDIFGQLLQYWKFNIDVQNCSVTVSQLCTENAECPGSTEVCQQTGYCNQSTTKVCTLDSECPDNEFCNSKKSTIIRDTRRLSDLRDVKDRLEKYNLIVRRYPALDNGTYLTNRTVSTWPSWVATFSSTLGSNLPSDPINILGPCTGYDAITCWNEETKRFAAVADPLVLPANSHAYYYQYKKTDNSYRFCSIVESGFVQGKTPGSEYCRTGRNCIRNCSGRNCGDDGCGGSCGSCVSGQTCQSGRCRNNTIQNQE